MAAAIPLAVFTVWLVMQIGGQRVGGGAREIGQVAAAAAAVMSCALMARRSSGRTRHAWALLAVSAGNARRRRQQALVQEGPQSERIQVGVGLERAKYGGATEGPNIVLTQDHAGISLEHHIEGLFVSQHLILRGKHRSL